MTSEEVQERLEAAIDALLRYDCYLLEIDAGERLISGCLLRYLVGVFPAHDVDVEYNRHGIDPKRVTGLEDIAGNSDGLIVPDIVVHQRGNDDNNLLAIEIKKTSNHEDRDRDKNKLRALRTEYRYEHCAFLEIPVADRVGERPIVEWIA